MSTRFNAMLPFVLVAACSDGATSETNTPAAVVDTGSAEDAVVVDTGSVAVEDTYESCGPGIEVTLCTIDGGGHTWPGGTPVPSLGWTSTSISATDRMWSFFVDHPMPR